jgi:hypothetical protein
MRYAPNVWTCSRHKEKETGHAKHKHYAIEWKEHFKGHLTIGLDLGDRSSSYCVLDEADEVLLEQKLPTTPEAMKQTFARIPQSRIALETGLELPLGTICRYLL